MTPSQPPSDARDALASQPGDQAALEAVLIDAFLENIPDSVYFKDTDSKFIAVCKAKAVRHGCSHPEELVGKTDIDIYAPAHAQKARQDEEKIMATGRAMVSEVEKIVLPDGEVRWARTTKLPLRDEEGRIVGTFGLSQDVTAAREIQESLEKAKKGLFSASRLAGMAEVATGVLHNVGNVLTSLNVSSGIVASRLRQSKPDALAKVAELLREHAGDLETFLASDPKGRLIPDFLESFARHLAEEQAQITQELQSLQKDIDHIKEIVTMQQAYATMAGIVESLSPAALMEDALRMNAAALMRHDVAVVRDFQRTPPVRAERGKVLQILINLVRNAKYAIDESAGSRRVLTLRIAASRPGFVTLAVEDTGTGISKENLGRIFTHGFTTRAGGHGFGLRSSALAAKEMGGALTASSAGEGQGARFVLELPSAEPS